LTEKILKKLQNSRDGKMQHGVWVDFQIGSVPEIPGKE
jgi:hypothetical protein